MAEQALAPIIPNMGGQEAAVAGSSAVIFTASDRKMIEEKGGRIDRNSSFIDLLKEKPLTPEVENEETTIKPQEDPKELEGRYREHQQMLKHSALYTPREKVEITNRLPDIYEEEQTIRAEPVTPDLSRNKQKSSEEENLKKESSKVREETEAIVKELKLDPAEIFDKFVLEQKALRNLVFQIKELHLKRLLVETKKEFESISEEIKMNTLSSAKTEARAWLEARLDKLTLDTAEYKLRLLESLKSIHLNDQRKNNISWLKKIIKRLS